jgi:hypothetical protein
MRSLQNIIARRSTSHCGMIPNASACESPILNLLAGQIWTEFFLSWLKNQINYKFSSFGDTAVRP